MGGDLVQQQQRRGAALGRQQAGVGKHDADQQRLLLAGGAVGGGQVLAGMTDQQIAAMRPVGGAAGDRIDRPGFLQPGAEAILDRQRGIIGEPPLDRAGQGQIGAREQVLGGGAAELGNALGRAQPTRSLHSR